MDLRTIEPPIAFSTLEAYYYLNKMGYATVPVNGLKEGARRIFFNIHMCIDMDPKEVDLLFKYSGYSPQKMPRLYKTYLDPMMLTLTRSRIKKRLQGKGSHVISVGFNFGTGVKDTVEKTGECLSGIGFYLFPPSSDETEWEAYTTVFLRSSEVTRRLLGDLLFIQQIKDTIFKGITTRYNKTFFHWGSCFTHAMHWVLWYQMFPGAMQENPDSSYLAHLRRIKEGKEIKYGPFQRAAATYLKNQEQKLPPLFSVSERTESLCIRGRESGLPAHVVGGSPWKAGR